MKLDFTGMATLAPLATMKTIARYTCIRLKVFLLVLGVSFGWGFAFASSPGQIVRGPTFEGVIFSPQMIANTAMKGEQHWDVPGVDLKNRNIYWTPSAELIRRAEASLATQFSAAQKRMPPGGPHAKSYYSPKHFSPDRERHVPDDAYENFLYDEEPDLVTPHLKRQYIGVTSGARRLLVMNLVFDDQPQSSFPSGPADSWKTFWLEMDDAGHSLVYDIASDKFVEANY